MKTCNEHICRSVPKAEAVDQANAILYFASDLSKAVTGQAFGSRLRLQSVKNKNAAYINNIDPSPLQKQARSHCSGDETSVNLR